MVISFNQAYMIRIKHSTTIFIILFFISNLFLASYYIDLWANDNTTSRVLPIISYLEQCNFQIDKYQKLTGDKSYVAPHYYTDKAPLPALVVLPFAGVLKSMGVLPNTNGSYYSPAVYAVGGFICGSLVFAFIVTLTFKALTRNKSAVSEGISPVLLAMLPFGIGFAGVFSPPAGLGQWGLFSWLLCFGLVARVGISFYTVPAFAVGVELTRDPKERSLVMTLRNIGARSAGLVLPPRDSSCVVSGR